MSSVVVSGDTSGSVTLQAPAVAGSTVLTLPTVTDTLVGKATTDTLINKTLTSPVIAGTPSGVGVLTLGTAVASTSGTSIDFTGIPSWAKRITVMFNGVSLNGASQVQMQLGTVSGVETTGYSSGAWVNNAGATSTSGLLCTGGFVAAWAYTGIATISLVGSNLWVASSNGNNSGASNLVQGAGSKTTAGILDRIRITTLNGTDTFDAGSINIMYE